MCETDRTKVTRPRKGRLGVDNGPPVNAGVRITSFSSLDRPSSLKVQCLGLVALP